MKRIIGFILVFVILCSQSLAIGEEFSIQSIPQNQISGAYFKTEGEFTGINENSSGIRFYTMSAHKSAFDYIYEELYNVYRINDEDYTGNVVYKAPYYCLELANNGYYVTYDELENILEQINCEHGEIMLYTTFSYSLTENEAYVADFGVKFLFDVSQLQTKRNEIDLKIDSFVSMLKTSGLKDLEKVLLVHDWICKNTIYQPDAELVDDLYYHNMHSAIVEGVSVCQGYTQAMCYILSKLDIECVSCLCEELDHVWNCVKLGEKWYHIDATWDDGMVLDDDGNVIFTYVLYNNFLKSASDIAANRGVTLDAFAYISGEITNADTENSEYTSGYIFNNHAQQYIKLNNEKIGADGFSYSDGKLIYTIKTDEGGYFESEYNFEYQNIKSCDYSVSKPVDVSGELQFMIIKQNKPITETFTHTGYMKNTNSSNFSVNTFSVLPAFEKTVGEYYTFSKISDEQTLDKIKGSDNTEFFFWDINLVPLTHKTSYENSN